eukprot:CAMPEP_0167753564 /NCGR_PEP_ID=MMETSP0110_2-20121227/7785_1 /TAXON_ID=629695 /ORGANISM="Gymnochlora sp., Strain CCMP2014" /LENGTH=451 /DNA_ID=CAMNT_0007639347 /DNA_START=121 /DNA_END=1476 /DNA_ORIENTATION=-
MLLAASGVAAYWTIKELIKRANIGGKIADGSLAINLMDKETGLLTMEVDSTTTVTFFEGKMPTEYLKKRLSEIFEKNPFLSGKLVTVGGKPKIIYHPESYKNIPYGIVRVLDCKEVKLSADSPPKQIKDIVEKAGCIVPKGVDLLDTGLPMLQLSLVKDYKQPDERFALIFSLNHIQGDGFTFYSVYKMLSKEYDVIKFISRRDPEFPENEKKVLKNEGGFHLMNSFSTMTILLTEALKSIFFGSNIFHYKCFCVDEKWINGEKSNHKQLVKEGKVSLPYISTNDAITSWYFNITGASLAFMAVNLRNRVENVGNLHVGNYENLIMYRRPDFKTPALLRESVNKLCRTAVPRTEFPSCFTLALSGFGNTTAATNWTTFYDDLVFDDCKQIYHIPVYDFESIGFGDLCDLVIFNPIKGKIALLCIGNKAAMDKVEASPVYDFPLTDLSAKFQ